MSYGKGDFEAGFNAAQNAAQVYRQLEDRFGLGLALSFMGSFASFRGDVALAEQVLTEAVGIGREIGSGYIHSLAISVLGRLGLSAAWRT